MAKKQNAHNQKDICDTSQAFLVTDLEFLQNHISASLLQNWQFLYHQGINF